MALKAAVIIPIYKPVIDQGEQESLIQAFKILGKHPIVFIKPSTLDISSYLPIIGHTGYNIETFDPHFFKDIKGYNELMLSELFYERFLQYDFMLIYQLDAFVFSDELLYWCEQGYDYIGGPWVERFKWKKQIRGYIHYKLNIKQKGSISPSPLQFYNRVGNGGFSLRRVRKFYEICKSHKKIIDFYNSNNEIKFFNEDVFWSLEVNRKKRLLSLPPYRKALYFAIEQEPRLALSLIKKDLPFGMHAKDVYPDVWNPIIQKAIREN